MLTTTVHGSTVSILQILKRERVFESEKRSNLKREIAKYERLKGYRSRRLRKNTMDNDGNRRGEQEQHSNNKCNIEE
jgi:hypothetical protein